MAKKKAKFNVGKIVTGLAAVMALVAFFLMFAPAVSIKNSDTTITGAQVTFGYDTALPLVKGLGFSSYFIPYLLVVAGIVFSVLSILGILPKISTFVSMGCYIAAGILFFLAVQMINPIVDLGSSSVGSSIAAETAKKFKETLALAGGAIASGVLSIVAGAGALSTLFIKK